MLRAETAREEHGGASAVLHWAAWYDLLVWLITLGREGALREQILRLAHLTPGESVLDVGCGTGTLAMAAKRQTGAAGTVCGIDASPEMISRSMKKANRAGLKIRFEEASVESLPFAEARFDLVLSTLMLHHLPASMRRLCAGEIRRVLKPGGRVLAVDFGTEPGHRGIVSHLHQHKGVGLDEMTGLFRHAGMQIAESGSAGISDLQYVLATSQMQPATH